MICPPEFFIAKLNQEILQKQRNSLFFDKVTLLLQIGSLQIGKVTLQIEKSNEKY